jgi:hypothetical protein
MRDVGTRASKVEYSSAEAEAVLRQYFYAKLVASR